MGQTVNLGQKDLANIKQQFTIGSLLQGRLENDLDFIGARMVRVFTINTVPLNDYNRKASSNRYGEPTEVGDTVQELPMTQDKGYTAIIDKGNNKDQVINKAGKFLRVQTDEEVIPMKDRYGFSRLANLAGTIVGAAAITKDNVIARMNAARTAFTNGRVPSKGRTWFVRPSVYSAMFECQPFTSLDKLGSKALASGHVGNLFGSPVVEVPDDLLPPFVNFLYVHKSAGASPAKIEDAKLHMDPPGISGHQFDFRLYWDTFVFGGKSKGIYVDVQTGSGGGTVLAAPTIAANGAITGASGSSFKYTTDGTDPRYSSTAVVGASPTVPAGETQTVRAYQYNESAGKEGTYPSPVAEKEVTGS